MTLLATYIMSISTKQAVFWLVLALGAAYLLARFFFSQGLPLPVSFYLVQSGSMEPAINTGDLVVVKSQPTYQDREVITFYDADHRVVTHRIMKTEEVSGSQVFTTKGDANEAPDTDAVTQDQVLGKVVMVLPKMGFVVSFAKTRYGALLLIIVPAVIIIYDEFRKMTKTK